MATTGENPVAIGQKNIKESKHTDAKKHQNLKKGIRIRNKVQWIYKTTREQLTRWQ